MLTTLTRPALRWMEEHRQRARLRQLLDHEDRLLEDVGLIRAEIEDALNQPITGDARDHAYTASARLLALRGAR